MNNNIKNDPYDLYRFIAAQKRNYDTVLAELRAGQKRTHWMWYVFPQISGLGFSTTSVYYSIKSRKEAQEYLKHPVLGTRLLECSEAVSDVSGRSASEIFGYPDDMKLKSSMTLFEVIAEPESVFTKVLDKYFNGARDDKTIKILGACRT